MMNLRQLLRRWLGMPSLPCAQTLPEPAWTREDAEHLRSFLCTPAGYKLRVIMLYNENITNASAVGQPNHLTREFRCGHATGVADAYRKTILNAGLFRDYLTPQVEAPDSDATPDSIAFAED